MLVTLKIDVDAAFVLVLIPEVSAVACQLKGNFKQNYFNTNMKSKFIIIVFLK